MKRITAFLCTLFLICGCLAGCSSGTPDTATTANVTTTAAAQATTTEAAQEETTAAPEETVGQSTADKEADLVIIGAGGAGLAAAVEAADNGVKNIVLLEKMFSIGGTTFTSQGMIAGFDTKMQKAQSIELTYDQMYDNLMTNALYRLDPELTAITVGSAGQTIDWLIDRLNVPFTENIRVGYGPLQMMHVMGSEEVSGGMALKEPFEAALDAAGVDLMLETRATRLIMNEDGSVGAVAAEQNGQEIIIKAKAVIIASGGYAYNPELTALLDPEMAGTYGIGHPASTGDGIIMASNVGAALTHTDHLMAVLKDYEIMEFHNGTSSSANVSRFIAAPNLLLVNTNAVRFVNEKSGGYMTQELNRPIFNEMTKTNSDYVWAISDDATISGLEIARGNEMEFIKADTIEELAGLMKVDAATLESTINTYNEYAANGSDPDFKRGAGNAAQSEPMLPLEAPYVAVAVVPCEIITYGGIARNVNAEVLRADNTVIPGLYVAGEASANSAYMGFTLSNCFTWGRIAGASAAKYIQK
ncbi:MAG: FAD-dependent oxidoreductase [Lachnospiraceae bacterium]|jgi:flavocytochrome c|nr:FAD-dependent oxidoreductase [Lachnospiraceae bacterium]